MADRYEPKLSVRPLSERKPAVSASSESDPLVELTRMVTGRSTFDPAPAAKNKTVPAAGPPPSAASSLGNDLESELLNGLQASFAAVREAVPPPAAPPPAPAPAVRSPAGAPLPQSARPQPAAPAPAADRAPRPERITPAPTPRPAPAAPQAAAPAQAKADRPASPAPQTLADRPSFFRSGNGPTVDLSHIQMRPSTPAAPHAEAPPVRTTSGRWDPPDETRSSAFDSPSRFAPPRAAVAFQPEAKAADLDEAEVEYEEELPFAEGEQAEEEFELEDIAPLPEYGEDGELPPFPEDELAGLSRRRANRTVILVAGLVVVAIAGGLAYFMLGDTGATTTPPIIVADATPTKVLPEQPLAGSEPAKESDRVDAVDNPDDTNLVTPGDTSIAELPPAEGIDNPISRVIVPAGPGFDGPIVDDAGTLAADGADPGQIGPKKVRTVVVRPDGTIVSSEAAVDGGLPPTSGATPPVEAATPDADLPVEVAAAPPASQTDMDAVLDGAGGDLAVDTDPLSAAGEPSDLGTAPATEPEALPIDPDPINTPPAAVAAPPPRPAKPPVASGGPGPLDLTPSKPAATPAAAGRGVLVQLSSQKSEDAARSAYQGLQRRYPGILGSFNANIQRADLGDRGIYYRVRVGPFSGGDATRLCEDLRAAGGDCIIAR